mgnify:CR=1 FL=1|jgi:hypothetical protein
MKKIIIAITLLALNTNLVQAKGNKSRQRYNKRSGHVARKAPRIIKNRINTVEKARTSSRHYRGERLPKFRDDDILCILFGAGCY